jgi:hypothetical protein
MRTEEAQQEEIERLESLKATYERKAYEMDAKIAKARNAYDKAKRSKVPNVWAHHVKTTVSFHRGFGGGYAEWDVDAEYKGEKFGFATISKPTYSHAKKTERKIDEATYEVTEWETYTGGSVKMKADFLEQCLRCARENATPEMKAEAVEA